MKVLHLSHSDIIGGAARASYRLHKALLKSDIDSKIMVRIKKSDDWTIQGPKSHISKLTNTFRATLGRALTNLQHSENMNLHSCNWLTSSWAKKINATDADLVHIHWIGNETLSIKDIGKIEKPIIWTMHDMWPFCGTEHYAEDQIDSRWTTGYTQKNRIQGDYRLDIDKLIWNRKIKAWKNTNMNIISPSKWLADCARKSILFRNSNINVIPNPLDTQTYKPFDTSFCREILRLPQNKNIILFGAISGGNDPRKGYNLLIDSLHKLKYKVDSSSTICVIFGQSKPKNVPELPFPTYWLGHLNDDPTLSLLYNSATVMVVPSTQEAFGQTASEAQACGKPVVAFSTTGLLDIVEHKKTGYLAKPFDTQDMADGLCWILNDKIAYSELCINARKRALELWADDIVTNSYLDIYKKII
jgi:glycosyltransferase involved in cell wall biosynthesis